jgi:LysR family transcriptional regulator, transcriptional activator of nhaA
MAFLNYHHLRYFWMIANEGSLTRAARRLNVSPSSLSIQLKTLEEQLGQALFERHGRSLQLTEAGRIALGYADALFKLGDEFISTLEGLRPEARQTLRVGAVSTLSRNFQIELLRPLFKRADVEVIIQSGTFAELLSRLRDHRLDIVLANQPAMQDQDEDWQSTLIAEQSVSLIGAPSLRMRKFRFPRDLVNVAVAVPGRGSGIRNAFEKLLETADVRPAFVAEVDDMTMLRLIARDGFSLVLVPPVVVVDELSSGLLKEHCTFPQIKEAFYAVTRRRQFPSPLLKMLDLHRRQL